MEPVDEQREEEARPPRTRGPLEDGRLADHQIREAMRRGEFDNLPGRGKPLNLDPRASSGDALVAGILKEANVVPEWIELARRIDEQREQLARETEAARARFAEHRAAAEALLTRWRAARHLEGRTRSVRPEGGRPGAWSFLRRVRAEDPRGLEAGLRQALAAGDRRRTEAFGVLCRRVYEINRRARRYNVVVPIPSRQRALLSLDDRAAEFARAWPALSLERRGDDLALRQEEKEPPRPAPPPDPEEERLARDPARLVALRSLVRGRRPPPIG